MKTIALIGQKGGTGKTTLATILAVAFEMDGFPTHAIDLDPQASLCGWSDDRGPHAPAVSGILPARLQKALQAAEADGVKVCIIDTAGRAEQAAMAALKAADLAIIPMQPSAADLRTIEAAKEQLKMAGDPPHFAVLCRSRSRGGRAVEAREFLEGQGITVCPHEIGDRVTYQDAFNTGMSPQEFEPTGRAADECNHVYMYARQKVGEIA